MVSAFYLRSLLGFNPLVDLQAASVKVGILAGGLGLRLSEETMVKPKPMVEIGGHPILWHIMMHYSHYGFDEFAIALGYKGECIRRCGGEQASMVRGTC